MKEAAQIIEDLEFLDEQRVGAAEAAQRTGFASAQAMEKWLERHDAYDLWLSMKGRDPAGMHHRTPEPPRECVECKEVKSASEFYRNEGRVRRRCKQCHNGSQGRRLPTVSRMVRTRARNRAYVLLAKAHAEEFEALMAFELERAATQHDALRAAAGDALDASVPRIKPGRRMPGEDAVDRLDVARCTRCHRHHDADHECPNCNEQTPDVADVQEAS